MTTNPLYVHNVGKRLLGLSSKEITTLAEPIIPAHMRLVIAQMEVEKLKAQRDKFISMIEKELETELGKIDLRLNDTQIEDIS